jgi:hypothetical protein
MWTHDQELLAMQITLPFETYPCRLKQITDLQLSRHGALNSQNLFFNKHILNSFWKLQYSWLLNHVVRLCIHELKWRNIQKTWIIMKAVHTSSTESLPHTYTSTVISNFYLWEIIKGQVKAGKFFRIDNASNGEMVTVSLRYNSKELTANIIRGLHPFGMWHWATG